MDNRLTDIQNATVRKANQLIQQSRFSLTSQQQKIVLYLIAQISPFDDDFKLYEFDTQEFCRVCGIDPQSGKNYADLKQAIKEISDKSLWVTLENGEETLLRWIEKPYVNRRDGVIRIRLDRDMKPFLLQLKANYTQFELIYTLNFKSKYTIRLYELIKSIHFHELESYTRRFSVDELKNLMDAKSYNEYRDFKRRVLLPSVEEINRSSDKTLALEEVKRGRKVVWVSLTITTKDALETLKLKSNIAHKLTEGEQVTLWDELQEKGLV